MWFWNCRKQETGEALVVSSCACACEEVSFANCYYRDAIFWSKDHATEDLPHFSIVHTVLPHSRQIYVHHMERFFSGSYGRGGEIAMTNDYELLKRYFSSPTNYCCKTTKSVLIVWPRYQLWHLGKQNHGYNTIGVVHITISIILYTQLAQAGNSKYFSKRVFEYSLWLELGSVSDFEAKYTHLPTLCTDLDYRARNNMRKNF